MQMNLNIFGQSQPTTEHFRYENNRIKHEFDIPMAKLIKEYENAPASQKRNVITKMQGQDR